jgi:integrase
VASIRDKKLSNGKTAYLVQYRTLNGQQRSKQFAKKVEARRFASDIESAKNRGEFVDPRAGKLALTDWWEQWYPTAAIRLARNTKDRDERMFKNHVKPRFGKTALARIDYLDICQWITDLANGPLGAESVQKCHQTLHKALQAAVIAGKLRHNPSDNVPLPKKVKRQKRTLDRDEIEALADVIDPRYRLFVWLAAYTGLREGEIAGLTWGALDLDGGWLHVRQQVTETAGHLEVTPVLKTAASNRHAPIPQFLCDILHIERDDAANDAFVVPNSEGGPLRPNTFRRRHFEPAWKTAGIGKVTPHELRHTCVTRWVDQGATPVQVKTWAGHESVVTILDLYAHHEDAAAQAIRDRMNDYATVGMRSRQPRKDR